ncbi:hypothetical protein BO78DRAFT_422430 [Aspergillus sclerotiicarbonarius CBS 121057]|uniref:Uncharacterized protein n=1 Tax=Aspergillus sclerotiicarbonarius (strain CBS 121057 / IBT 28362) TaxID=1448318 RepID=A0A319DXH0_ASPSB|nr:hypothetical protein BO78DRAFT_422430 [Aspergillus sclerotiicarbonarius CBS 121057]
MPAVHSATGQWYERLKQFFEEQQGPDGHIEQDGFKHGELQLDVETGISSRDISRRYIEYLSTLDWDFVAISGRIHQQNVASQSRGTLYTIQDGPDTTQESPSTTQTTGRTTPPWNARNIPTGPTDLPYDTITLSHRNHGQFLIFIVGEALPNHINEFDLNLCLFQKLKSNETRRDKSSEISSYGAVLNGEIVSFWKTVDPGVESSVALLQGPDEQFFFHQEIDGEGIRGVMNQIRVDLGFQVRGGELVGVRAGGEGIRVGSAATQGGLASRLFDDPNDPADCLGEFAGLSIGEGPLPIRTRPGGARDGAANCPVESVGSGNGIGEKREDGSADVVDDTESDAANGVTNNAPNRSANNATNNGFNGIIRRIPNGASSDDTGNEADVDETSASSD